MSPPAVIHSLIITTSCQGERSGQMPAHGEADSPGRLHSHKRGRGASYTPHTYMIRRASELHCEVSSKVWSPEQQRNEEEGGHRFPLAWGPVTFVWKDLEEPDAIGCLHIRELTGETEGGKLCCKPPFELGRMCLSYVFKKNHQFSSVQFSSFAQLCLTLCDPVNRSTPGRPVHHQVPEFTQTHVHRVRDAIQPSHPLSSPSPPAPNPSQHQSLFQ